MVVEGCCVGYFTTAHHKTLPSSGAPESRAPAAAVETVDRGAKRPAHPITTRTDPPLPLARWRVRQQLVEIRADDLRFTPAETATFLNQMMGLNLSPADIALLETRTEGWVAGLQMAALSMQGRGDITRFLSSFTGSHRYILDYLMDEALQQQLPDTQEFLLKTSLLNRLSGPLCNAVLGQDNSQMMLEQLEQANLFVLPLDDERRWYRYHHLFAEALRHRLIRPAQPSRNQRQSNRPTVWPPAADPAIQPAHPSRALAPARRRLRRRAQPAAGETGRGQSGRPGGHL